MTDGLLKESTPPVEHVRPTWDEHGLNAAFAASLRGDCTRRRVGAALMLPDKSIVVSGYNGGPPGGPSCLAGECPRGRLTHDELSANSDYSSGAGKCVALHAEWNVFLRASWQQMQGSTLYVTTEPCHLCWTLIKGTGIKRVVWVDFNIDLNKYEVRNWSRSGYIPGRVVPDIEFYEPLVRFKNE